MTAPDPDRELSRDVLMQRVLEVERFIGSCRIDTPNGTVWSRTPDRDRSPSRTLYHGSAGIIVFLLELHRATGSARFLDDAISAGNELLTHLDGPDGPPTLTIGFYSGWPGHVFVLNELARATGDTRFSDAASSAVVAMIGQSQQLGAGIGWIEPMPFSDITGMTGDREVLDLSIGAAGAGLGLLYAHRAGLDERALGWARQTADRLLEMSVDTDDGPNWLMMADMPFPFTAPNFAHGAAGVGYFLADLHRATGESRYLDAAIDAAGYVGAHTTPSGDGHLVCHTEEQPGLHYLGVCHGPPGTGRLMHLLATVTGDSAWTEWMHGNMRGLRATGAPEVRSDGLWSNYGQCCGDAGIGDYSLSLARSTGDMSYHGLAQRVATETLARSECAEGRRWWTQAEHRNRPTFLEAQTGYMQGAAGIGSFLLHLATFDDDDVSKIPLADSPFAPRP